MKRNDGNRRTNRGSLWRGQTVAAQDRFSTRIKLHVNIWQPVRIFDFNLWCMSICCKVYIYIFLLFTKHMDCTCCVTVYLFKADLTKTHALLLRQLPLLPFHINISVSCTYRFIHTCDKHRHFSSWFLFKKKNMVVLYIFLNQRQRDTQMMFVLWEVWIQFTILVWVWSWVWNGCTSIITDLSLQWYWTNVNIKLFLFIDILHKKQWQNTLYCHFVHSECRRKTHWTK